MSPGVISCSGLGEGEGFAGRGGGSPIKSSAEGRAGGVDFVVGLERVEGFRCPDPDFWAEAIKTSDEGGDVRKTRPANINSVAESQVIIPLPAFSIELFRRFFIRRRRFFCDGFFAHGGMHRRQQLIADSAPAQFVELIG